MKLSQYTQELLADIENRIDPAVEDAYLSEWEAFLHGGYTQDIFSPVRKKQSVSGVKLRKICINDAIRDYDLMLASQLTRVSNLLESGKGALGVRANYGTGIMTSLFGAKIFIMPEETDTLPTTRIVSGSRIEQILAEGIPSLTGGLGKNVFEMGEIYLEVFEKYPKIKTYVTVYHPDTQGPVDICELLWGCEMFYAMYDDPDKVHALLRIITDTYMAVLKKWFAMFPPQPISTHSLYRHRGSIMLRDDSAMNLSPELYTEFGYHYDKTLLSHFNGGVVHFCGRGDHYIEILTQSPFLTGIDMSQPEYNDMEKIYTHTVDKGIPLLAFNKTIAERDKIRNLHGLVNC